MNNVWKARVGINCNKRSDMTFYLNKSDLRVQLNHKTVLKS